MSEPQNKTSEKSNEQSQLVLFLARTNRFFRANAVIRGFTGTIVGLSLFSELVGLSNFESANGLPHRGGPPVLLVRPS